jgi:hypothetical protein
VRQAGQIAKINIYKAFIKRIEDGEQLKPMELKQFHSIERELEQDLQKKNGATSGLITGYKEACDYLGISKRMMSYHVTKGNLKQNKDGTFEILELQRWAKKYKRKNAKGGNYPDIDERLQKADLRFRQARARREEMLVRQIEGTLLSQKEVAEAWAKRKANMRSSLLTFVDRLPPMIEGKSRKQISGILKNEIYYFLDQYAQDGKYCPEN